MVQNKNFYRRRIEDVWTTKAPKSSNNLYDINLSKTHRRRIEDKS